MVGISIQMPNTSAGSVNHTVGNLDIKMLMDYGRILYPINWGGYQTVQDDSTLGFTGLVIDHDNYNHAPGAEDIADCYNTTSPYLTPDDFRSAKDITMLIDDGTTQRSFGSFQNKGAGTGYPDDILINQTCWTVKNKDWAIIQWTLTNIKSPSSPLANVRIGLEVQISKEGGRFGLGGDLDDSGDDIDGYDAGNAVYWAQDTGDGTTIGFGSAIVTDPITHYYAEDYHADYSSEYVNFFGNDTWLYHRLQAPNATATDGITPGNITTTLGWDGFDILALESRTVALVIAIDDSYAKMITALKDAQNYYHYEGPGFRITEFSDSSSGTQQIEVFNYGHVPTDLPAEGYFFSVDGGTNSLTGTWINNPLPTYEYAVFTLNPGEIIGAEGDTIGLYQDLGGGNKVLVNEISFGQEGVAPDPIAGESTARIWYPSIEEYSIYWTRASTSTFGAQNDVPSINSNPSVVLNEVMFNPSIDPDGKYLVIINKGGLAINVANYCLVCDDYYNLPTIVIPPYTSHLIDYTTAPLLFNSMDSTGDNVYLYDNNGQLLDMVGWNTPHNQGMSVRRVPEGYGGYQGYDDISSVSAGWVFDSPLKVLMTEISDDGSTQAQIEVYNPWYSIIDFSIGYTFESGSTPPGPLSGAWWIKTANTGEHAVFNVNSGLDTEGDTISLYQNGELIEEISYGQKGLVPDPLKDESVQRYWDGSKYTNLWGRNLTSGPNFGAKNDIPVNNPTSPIFLNEVLFNPSDTGNYYVEVVSQNGTPVDISGWKIVSDTEYTIPNGILLDLNQRFFYLLYNMQQQFFDDPINGMSSSGDNVYLYDVNGSLVDMVGWNSAHNIDGTVCRFPEGNGTRNGYDNESSMAAGWLFNCTPTVRLVKIDINKTVHEEPIEYGHIGGNAIFNLTILNLQRMGDIIHILNSSQEGWTARVFDETGNLEIENITVNANGTVNIIVKVTLPDALSSTFMDNITILIRSSNSKLIHDSIVLNVRVFPFLNLTKNANPNQIFLNGTGHDEITTITLEMTGMGLQGTRTYIDCVFCIDSSGSMGSNDPSGLRKSESQNFVTEHFEVPDRAAVVDFDSVAFLQPDGWLIGDHLSSDYGKIIANIGLIDSSGGTSVSSGLNMSNEELRLYGQPVDHAPIIILITDARTGGDVQACLNEANIAASRGVTIFTIGLKTNGTSYEQLLKDIANITGGMYFEAPNASHFKCIYENISGFLKDIAAWDNDTTDPNPMLRDVLPWYVDYVQGSFSIQPDNIYNDSVTGETIIEWNIPWVKFGETWSVSFDVKLNLPGLQETNIYDKSRAFYTTWDDNTDTVLFPRCKVYVLTPAPLPPKLYIDILPNKNDISLFWDDPLSSATDHYLIYNATSPTGFDFSSPWIDTSVNLDPLDPGGIAVGNRSSWNHTGAADPTNVLEYSEQWYYCIRSVNNMGEISRTSRTVGKWTREFTQAGVYSFSLPLEPIETMTPTADFFVNDMGANYIKCLELMIG
jgi:hypothetical protein